MNKDLDPFRSREGAEQAVGYSETARYASVGEVADDILHYLNDSLVAVQHCTANIQFEGLTGRSPLRLLTMSSLAGSIPVSWQLRRISKLGTEMTGEPSHDGLMLSGPGHYVLASLLDSNFKTCIAAGAVLELGSLVAHLTDEVHGRRREIASLVRLAQKQLSTGQLDGYQPTAAPLLGDGLLKQVRDSVAHCMTVEAEASLAAKLVSELPPLESVVSAEGFGETLTATRHALRTSGKRPPRGALRQEVDFYDELDVASAAHAMRHSGVREHLPMLATEWSYLLHNEKAKECIRIHQRHADVASNIVGTRTILLWSRLRAEYGDNYSLISELLFNLHVDITGLQKRVMRLQQRGMAGKRPLLVTGVSLDATKWRVAEFIELWRIFGARWGNVLWSDRRWFDHDMTMKSDLLDVASKRQQHGVDSTAHIQLWLMELSHRFATRPVRYGVTAIGNPGFNYFDFKAMDDRPGSSFAIRGESRSTQRTIAGELLHHGVDEAVEERSNARTIVFDDRVPDTAVLAVDVARNKFNNITVSWPTTVTRSRSARILKTLVRLAHRSGMQAVIRLYATPEDAPVACAHYLGDRELVALRREVEQSMWPVEMTSGNKAFASNISVMCSRAVWASDTIEINIGDTVAFCETKAKASGDKRMGVRWTSSRPNESGLNPKAFAGRMYTKTSPFQYMLKEICSVMDKAISDTQGRIEGHRE